MNGRIGYYVRCGRLSWNKYCRLCCNCLQFPCQDGVDHDFSCIKQIFHSGAEDIYCFAVFLRYFTAVICFLEPEAFRIFTFQEIFFSVS